MTIPHAASQQQVKKGCLYVIRSVDDPCLAEWNQVKIYDHSLYGPDPKDKTRLFEVGLERKKHDVLLDLFKTDNHLIETKVLDSLIDCEGTNWGQRRNFVKLLNQTISKLGLSFTCKQGQRYYQLEFK